MTTLTLVPRNDSASPRVIHSDLLGNLEIQPSDVVTFPVGLLGFPECRDFALLRGERDGLYWLQSTEYSPLVFLLVDPFTIADTYTFDVSPTQIAELGDTQSKNIGLLAIVTLPSGVSDQPTVNLQAPLVINFKTRRAKQLVSADEQFGVRCPVDLARLVA